jgi:hypothetical protein
VPLAGLDMHHIADSDLPLLMLRGHNAGAGSDDQDLIARMGVPSGRGALAEVDDTTAIVLGVPITDDGLP